MMRRCTDCHRGIYAKFLTSATEGSIQYVKQLWDGVLEMFYELMVTRTNTNIHNLRGFTVYLSPKSLCSFKVSLIPR